MQLLPIKQTVISQSKQTITTISLSCRLTTNSVSESHKKKCLTDMTILNLKLPLQEKADEDDKVIDTDLIEPGTQSQWHEAYYTLTLLVKIMKRCPKEVNSILRTRIHTLLE